MRVYLRGFLGRKIVPVILVFILGETVSRGPHNKRGGQIAYYKVGGQKEESDGRIKRGI